MGRIGFIGLGIMGCPMAKNLIKAGKKLMVYDIREERMTELVGEGASRGDSPKDVASRCETILTMLPNSPEVREVILGKNGVIEGVRSGSTVVDMSSIAPSVSVEVCTELQKKGVEMLDAPVSGGEPKAMEGTLAFMVGGKAETFARVKDLLGAMGASVIHVGEIGSGNITKLANQIIVALNIAAMSEAMVLAAKAGVDPEKVFNAIKGGLAGSAVLNAKMPLVLKGCFKPGFRIELHIKDLNNAIETAHRVGVPVPLTGQVLEIMQALKIEGKAGDDHGGLIQFYEKLSKFEVRKE